MTPWRARCGDNSHGGFGGRAAETHQPKGRQGAAVRPYTEHPAREGKLDCCVVLDAYSRRVIGWAIDARQRADLATAALGMAIKSRGSAGHVPGGIIHADHGTQFTSWTFTERARQAGLLPSLGSVGDPYDCETVLCVARVGVTCAYDWSCGCLGVDLSAGLSDASVEGWRMRAGGDVMGA
jgi:transposase InsO family protein